MKYLLSGLAGTSVQLRIGRYEILTYGDGTMAARQDGTGLMSQVVKINQAGLMRVLAWIDMEEGL